MAINTLPWIESPFFAKELAEAGLTPEEKAFVKSYADNGYIIFDPQVPEGMIDELNRSMQPKFDAIPGNDKRIQDAWKYNLQVKALASLPTVYEKLELLYRRRPIPFQTLSFYEGTQQDTHSDMIHFNSIPYRYMCGVWIALEDITDFNGPLHYYPGSHKLPFYDMIDVGVKATDKEEEKKSLMGYLKDYSNFIKKIIDSLGLQKATLNIKKGQAIIWSANLLHGGNEILHKGSTRLSQVTHYFFENCMYYAPRLSDVAINKMYMLNLVDISTGEPVENTYFGETIHPGTRLALEQRSRRMLSQIAHFFPPGFVAKIKSISGFRSYR
jgi:hypothetical protein